MTEFATWVCVRGRYAVPSRRDAAFARGMTTEPYGPPPAGGSFGSVTVVTFNGSPRQA